MLGQFASPSSINVLGMLRTVSISPSLRGEERCIPHALAVKYTPSCNWFYSEVRRIVLVKSRWRRRRPLYPNDHSIVGEKGSIEMVGGDAVM